MTRCIFEMDVRQGSEIGANRIWTSLLYSSGAAAPTSYNNDESDSGDTAGLRTNATAQRNPHYFLATGMEI